MPLRAVRHGSHVNMQPIRIFNYAIAIGVCVIEPLRDLAEWRGFNANIGGFSDCVIAFLCAADSAAIVIYATVTAINNDWAESIPDRFQ